MDFVTVMNDSSKGLFLIFLAIICNFLADTMNCGVQLHLTQRAWLKWVVVFMLIYFTINFTSDPKANPFIILGNSVFVFFLFVLFMKQNIYSFMLGLSILLLIFTLNQWINYYKLKEIQDEKTEKMIENLKTTCLVLQIMLLLILVGGTIMYASQQIEERKIQEASSQQAFDINKFFFGTNKCAKIIQQQRRSRSLYFN